MRNPFELDLAAGDTTRWLEQADDRHSGDRLPGAGFADHAEHLARRDLERDTVDRGEHAAARGELDAQLAHFEQRGGAHCSFGLSASRSQSPSRLTDMHSSTSARPGSTTSHHSPE